MRFKVPYRLLILFGCLVFSHMPNAFCQPVACEDLFRKDVVSEFIHSKNQNLHNTDEVNNAAVQSGLSRTSLPTAKLRAWLNHLENSFAHASKSENEIDRTAIKSFYRNALVTKPEDAPESFFDLQKRIARNQGHGDITMTPDMRRRLVTIALNDQTKSLDAWLDYFLSRDSASYPMWTKYWALTAIGRMAQFDSDKGLFSSRGRGTMTNFPDLNREAFAIVVDAIVKKVGGRSLSEIQDAHFLNIIETQSFSKMYGYALMRAKANVIDTSSVDGRWIKYLQGSDHMPLVKSLVGQNTGWCTAGEETAESQLQNGDFHVFYTRDINGSYSVPRVGIRMQGHSIAEVRGVAKEQNLDGPIAASGAVENKLREFGAEGETYKRRAHDMKLLTAIEEKSKSKQLLTAVELRFLYEITDDIEGFGYSRDPRIAEIIAARPDKSADLNEAFSGMQEINRSLDLSYLDSANGLRFPPRFHGNLNMNGVMSANGMELPDTLDGSLSLENLKEARGSRLPKFVKGNVFLGIENAEGVQIPATDSDLLLKSLKSARGLVLPNRFHSVDLSGLENADGLILPDVLPGSLLLNSLKSAQHLQLSRVLRGNLSLSGLESALDLKMSREISGKLILHGLKSTQGLTWPDLVGGGTSFRPMGSGKDLIMPRLFRGDLIMSLSTAYGASLPEILNGNFLMYLSKDVSGVRFPKIINGDLDVSHAAIAEGTIWPQQVTGKIKIKNRELLPKHLR